jgi:hypothetical protein
LRYRLEHASLAVLLDAGNSLFDWVQLALPEDLSLFRGDGTAWLTTIAHEHEAYFTLTSPERERLLAAVPELAPPEVFWGLMDETTDPFDVFRSRETAEKKLADLISDADADVEWTSTLKIVPLPLSKDLPLDLQQLIYTHWGCQPA